MKIKGILFILAACIAHISAMEPTPKDVSAQEQMERLFTEKLPAELQDMIINKVLESPFPKTKDEAENFLKNYLNMIVQLDPDFFPQETKKQYLNKFAKQWYLNYGKYLKVPETWIKKHFPGQTPDEVLDYGFSIKELLQANKLPERLEGPILGTTLNLRRLRINDLDGLKEIPNIENLFELDLMFNQIPTIESEAFDGLNLARIHLAFNQIRTIGPNAFAGLKNLELLNLDRNQISAIALNAFADLNNLETLGLIGNELRTVKPNTFARLKSLTRLDLWLNPLTVETKKALQKQLGNRVRL